VEHLAGEAAEGGVVDEGGEVVLIWGAEGGIVLVEPGDGELEGATGVEAGGAGIGLDEGFGFGGGEVDVGPLGLEEAEVGHGSELSSEGAVLEGGVEGVEVGEGAVSTGLELVGSADFLDERSLDFGGRFRDGESFQIC
jgi:hypothetical protein